MVIAKTYRHRGCRQRTVAARARRAVRDRNGTERDRTGHLSCPPPRRMRPRHRRSWSTSTAEARRPCGNRIRRSGDGVRCPTAHERRPACPVWGRRGTRDRHWCQSTGIPPLTLPEGTTSAQCPPSNGPIGRVAPSVPTNPKSVRWKQQKQTNFKIYFILCMIILYGSDKILLTVCCGSTILCTEHYNTRP